MLQHAHCSLFASEWLAVLFRAFEMAAALPFLFFLLFVSCYGNPKVAFLFEYVPSGKNAPYIQAIQANLQEWYDSLGKQQELPRFGYGYFGPGQVGTCCSKPDLGRICKVWTFTPLMTRPQ